MDSRSLPPVSIFIPVHNEAEHLSECIESILVQTYRNWECTIVDNCSTDGSADIARRYAAKDGRVRVIQNQQLLPALPNFNLALRQISPASKYCKLVFGDDWIYPECLERMVAVAEEHPSIGIVGAYILEGKQVTCVGLPTQSMFVSGREICRKHFLEDLYLFGASTAVLYRADLVRSRDPFFNEANIHADTEACFALLETSDFGFVHQVLTFRRVRSAARSTEDNENGTPLGGFLEILVKHGPACLSPDELNARLSRHLSEYYDFLGKSLILGRRKLFWVYHKTKLAEAGVGFSRVRVARGALANLAEAGLNPKSGVEKLLKRWRSRISSKSTDNARVNASGMEDWSAWAASLDAGPGPKDSVAKMQPLGRNQNRSKDLDFEARV